MRLCSAKRNMIFDGSVEPGFEIMSYQDRIRVTMKNSLPTGEHHAAGL